MTVCELTDARSSHRMNSTRDNKRRRLREQNKIKNQLGSEISDNSNFTNFEECQQLSQSQISANQNESLTEFHTASVSVGDHRVTNEKRPISELVEDSEENRVKDMKNDQSPLILESCSSAFMDSECGTTWLATESSCLSVNGPNRNPLLMQQMELREQDEVTSLPTPDALAVQLRNSLTTTTTTINHSTHVSIVSPDDSNVNKRGSISEASSCSDDGEDAFADEEWEIPKEYIPTPYRVDLDWEE